MAMSFEERWAPIQAFQMAAPDDPALRHKLYQKTNQMRIDSLVDKSFPSQGTPQGSHEGSQSDTPNKDNP